MTPQPKHTPGPWIYHNSDDGVKVDRIYSGSTFVAEIGRTDSQANARLIAAAPGLLAATRLALETFEREHNRGGSYPAEILALRAAIARAEGR